jgi:hypothetical protein
MPAVAGVVQAVTGLGIPAISTMQSLQAPNGFSLSS